MLRRDVVAAAEAGQFPIFPVETVDQAIAILTVCRPVKRMPAAAIRRAA